MQTDGIYIDTCSSLPLPCSMLQQLQQRILASHDTMMNEARCYGTRDGRGTSDTSQPPPPDIVQCCYYTAATYHTRSPPVSLPAFASNIGDDSILTPLPAVQATKDCLKLGAHSASDYMTLITASTHTAVRFVRDLASDHCWQAARVLCHTNQHHSASTPVCILCEDALLRHSYMCCITCCPPPTIQAHRQSPATLLVTYACLRPAASNPMPAICLTHTAAPSSHRRTVWLASLTDQWLLLPRWSARTRVQPPSSPTASHSKGTLQSLATSA